MPRRTKHKTGIRTDAPHRLWHMDITVFRTADNVPVYIYILDYAHRYLTPVEVLEGAVIDPDKFKKQLKQARITRISQHRNPECRVCTVN